MKTFKSIGGLAAAVLLVSALAVEATVNIQNVGAGARAAALGHSFVAVADDPDAVFENPAGLGQLSRRQVSYTNVSLFYGGIEGDDLGQHVVSLVQPLGTRLGLGVGYERIGSEVMSENGAFVALSYKVGGGMYLGLTGKYLFWQVEDFDPADPVSGTTKGNVGVDVGVLWQSPWWGTRWGVLVKNVNQPDLASKRSGTAADGSRWTLPSEAGKLPMDLHLGMSYRVDEGSLVSVQWVVRDLGGANDSRVLVGGELAIGGGLLLRAGGSKIFVEEATGTLNAGLGYGWHRLGFDYGYELPLDLTETNGTHRFSFSYQF